MVNFIEVYIDTVPHQFTRIRYVVNIFILASYFDVTSLCIVRFEKKCISGYTRSDVSLDRIIAKKIFGSYILLFNYGK